MYDQYFITLYNIVYTSLPVLAMGVFDQVWGRSVVRLEGENCLELWSDMAGGGQCPTPGDTSRWGGRRTLSILEGTCHSHGLLNTDRLGESGLSLDLLSKMLGRGSQGEHLSALDWRALMWQLLGPFPHRMSRSSEAWSTLNCTSQAS